MKFTEALEKLAIGTKFPTPKNKTSDAFFCIVSQGTLHNSEALIMDYYGLRRVSLNDIHLEAKEFTYLVNGDFIFRKYFKDKTWMYFETWTDLIEARKKYSKT